MKRIMTLALFSTVCLTTWIGAAAQEPRMTANIPFDFTVGHTKMPAGKYRISSPADWVLRLQSADDTSAANIVSLRSGEAPGTTSELVFRKYGDRYFLHRVVSASIDALNVEIAPGKAEKEARQAQAKLHTGQDVLVAAR